MRRPSRQGLVPVCKRGTVTVTAESHSHEKPFSVLLLSSFSFLLFAGSASVAGAQDLEREIHRYFKEIQKEHYAAPHTGWPTAHPEETLRILQPFLKDSSSALRQKAYELVYALSSTPDNPFLRHKCVGALLDACRDEHAAVRTTALRLLTRFKKSDFNLAAKDSLRNLIRSKAAPLDRLIKLGAFLQLTDLIPDIQRLSQPGNPTWVRWAALQSLARMGQPDAVRDMMARIEKLPVNDDLVYKVFPDLIFTRQRDAIGYVVEALRSDQKNCLSADVEREVAIPCGYRIMEQLAPVIKDFPFELDASGDLKARDYAAALNTVTEWFRIHNTYSILNDSY